MSEHGRRIVAVGDLNGAADALVEILLGTGLLNRAGRWAGGRAHLIQVGDVFNRGDGAKDALELLLRLRGEAAKAGGQVTVLLGNHEVMTVLGHEAYCTEGEYLQFAGARERERWPLQVDRAMRRLLSEYPPGGPIPPLKPRLDLWTIENVPGKAAMRRALGPKGKLGRAIRSFPLAVREAGCVFVHAGVTAPWARLGLDGLNRALAEAWTGAPGFYPRLSPRSVLRARNGPLWSRSFAHGGEELEPDLDRSLAALGAERMVIGHTQTRHTDGADGRILSRFGGRLICIDVSLREGEGQPRAALVVEGGSGSEWTQEGRRVLWRGGK